jgi:uncharacterized membrane protein
MTGRILISLVSVLTIVTPWLADWNETHVFNDAWSPHARFHVGHTMLLGTVLGLLALHLTWRRTGDGRDDVRTAALVAASYWIAQAGAILVPGTATVDPEFAHRLPVVAGVRANQVMVDALLLAVIGSGYHLHRRALGRSPARQARATGAPDRHGG